jgi:hypothetical protein
MRYQRPPLWPTRTTSRLPLVSRLPSSPVVGEASEARAGAFRRSGAARSGAASKNAWVSLPDAFATVLGAGDDVIVRQAFDLTPLEPRSRSHRHQFQCIQDGYRLADKSLEAEMRRREFIAGLAGAVCGRHPDGSGNGATN